jgi:shikimate kinase
MNSKLIRTPGLYLVGFMGSGKTTVGRLLGDELGWNFIDLDDDIEAEAGCTITAIFEEFGEEEFRRREHEALKKRVRGVQFGEPSVVSLGGGAFAQEKNINLLSDNGISIWLDCPWAIIKHRVEGEMHRPLARDPVKFEALFHSRQAAYARADYRVGIMSDDPAEAVRSILDLPVF